MKTLSTAVLMALVVSSAGAFAGTTQPAPVEVDLDLMFAHGDMESARWAKGDDLIGCGIRTFDNGAGGVVNIGFCQAQDGDGDSAICTTDRMDLLETMYALNDDSYIRFSWDMDGNCTVLGFSTQSLYHNKDNPSFINKKN
ncbi:hypothetical protein [Bowmanella dokdonensis]|uniref:Uncharacterized protein n=1 Tax=Bowmanella dokdonensis TaxID=751969 RepID=A0A939IRY9_9ALTE|nr:hypothetical protein [Bowmanella dokdonensis]MBN7826157.1 hypothetical protein [Bowmanella dokdonensis]